MPLAIWIFIMCNDFTTWCAHRVRPTWTSLCRCWLRRTEKGLHPAASQSQTLDTGLTVKHLSRPATNSSQPVSSPVLERHNETTDRSFLWKASKLADQQPIPLGWSLLKFYTTIMKRQIGAFLWWAFKTDTVTSVSILPKEAALDKQLRSSIVPLLYNNAPLKSATIVQWGHPALLLLLLVLKEFHLTQVCLNQFPVYTWEERQSCAVNHSVPSLLARSCSFLQFSPVTQLYSHSPVLHRSTTDTPSVNLLKPPPSRHCSWNRAGTCSVTQDSKSYSVKLIFKEDLFWRQHTHVQF